MSEDYADWNTKYMLLNNGRAYKISKMSLNQVDKGIRHCKLNLKVNKVYLDGLYQRRWELLRKTDPTYTKRNTKVKIAQTLGMNNIVKKDERLKAILLTAVDFLEKGQPTELVLALLKQARDEEND